MLQLLQPIALIAAAGIIIPVIIHLWNISAGKTLKVGSIALLKESSRQTARSFKIMHWLLLVVRCLLLLVLAAFLAEPMWKEPEHKGDIKGWVLVDRHHMKETYQQFSPTIDSLLQQGYELHGLNADFPQISLSDTVQSEVAQPASPALPYWSFSSALAQEIPADLPVYAFTPNRLTDFAGKRPSIHTNLQWFTYIPSDTANAQLLQAFQTADDSIRLVVSQSHLFGNNIQYLDRPSGESDAVYSTAIQQGKPLISLKEAPTAKVVLDTATMHITIHAAQKADAYYVEAALKAIQSFTKRPMQISHIQEDTLIADGQDVLFWLSEMPLPEQAKKQVKASGMIFSYAKGTQEKIQTTLSQYPEYRLSSAIALYQRIAADTIEGETIWQDAFGNPVLIADTSNPTSYYFLSRFDPVWTELVWSPQLVLWLLPLILPDQEIIANIDDQRLIAQQQIQPVTLQGPPTVKPAQRFLIHDLALLFWMIAFLLFVVERLLTYYQKPIAS